MVPLENYTVSKEAIKMKNSCELQSIVNNKAIFVISGLDLIVFFAALL